MLGLGAFSALAYLAFTRYWWIPLIPPVIAWLLAAIGSTAYFSYREARERAALMALFSRQVSPQVAEAIWEQREEFADGGRPRSQRLIVTAFFADLAGYTPTAESMSPEQLLDWLNESMEIIAREIGRHGGIVEQYVGDEVVGIFGAPLSHTTEAEIRKDAIGAVECALTIAEALIPLNRQFRENGRPTAALRIGIFTGPAVSGLVGSADRAEYVVVGDTINTASRLESFDKDEYGADPNAAPCRILIGGSTLAYLPDHYITEFVGERLLKGKRQPVAMHRVLGRRCEN